MQNITICFGKSFGIGLATKCARQENTLKTKILVQNDTSWAKQM